MKTQHAVLFTTLLAALSTGSSPAQDQLFWPINDDQLNPVNEGQITSNFGDYRGPSPANPATVPHFHLGLDFAAGIFGDIVVSVMWGTVVPGGRTESALLLDHVEYQFIASSHYIHLNPTDEFDDFDDVFVGTRIADAHNLELNHLHMNLITDRKNSIDDADHDVRNPLATSVSGLGEVFKWIPDPIPHDDAPPTLHNVYWETTDADDSAQYLAFPYDNYETYFEDVNGHPTFKKLTLPAETPGNHEDDPHIWFTGNGGTAPFRLYVQSTDKFGPSGTGLTPRKLGVLIGSTEIYRLNFKRFPGGVSDQEESVYSSSDPVKTVFATSDQFYKIFNDSPTPPVVEVSRESIDIMDVNNGFHQGTWIIGIEAFDEKDTRKSGAIVAYFQKNADWVCFMEPTN